MLDLKDWETETCGDKRQCILTMPSITVFISHGLDRSHPRISPALLLGAALIVLFFA